MYHFNTERKMTMNNNYKITELSDEKKNYVFDKYCNSWHLGKYSKTVQEMIDKILEQMTSVGFVKPQITMGHVYGKVSYQSINEKKATWIFNKRLDIDTEYQFVHRTDQERNVLDFINNVNKTLTDFLCERYTIETTEKAILEYYKDALFDKDGNQK